MNEQQFKEFELTHRMDIVNLNGTYVGNRSCYNHSIKKSFWLHDKFYYLPYYLFI